MNIKNNRRRRESIERIESVFIELLYTKTLNEISVSEICKRCGLNRSTFYANFADIYDLADKVCSHLEEEVGQLYADERMQGYNSNDYLKLFYHIKENQELYHTYFKLDPDKRLKNLRYDSAQAAQRYEDQYIGYHIEFFRNGFNAIVKMWLNGGCKESPEEMELILRSEYQGRVQYG